MRMMIHDLQGRLDNICATDHYDYLGLVYTVRYGSCIHIKDTWSSQYIVPSKESAFCANGTYINRKDD